MAGRASQSSAPAKAPGTELACRAARTALEQAAHFRIRHEVFVREQRLFLAGDSDRDSRDADPATVHVVGLVGGDICGTVRLYQLRAGGYWKGDRLAVLPGYRHLGLGAPLVRFAVTTAAGRGGREMEAYIQPANVTFFEWLGWRRSGGLVEYVGIQHQRMVIDLTAVPPGAAPAE
ncbi:MAG TPA: MSMEG_0567/Sll0786 family nitrogen starvation N-acetyltransferase [Streptosporangiaceae bacterium]